jgi:2-oxoglutarate dehydrogenase E2 component (dihydrolipoamide succinyltransferase)
MADVTMPQLGETVTEGTITKWMKQVGDRVEEDEILYEVSTDKVDSEVPSSETGFLAEILVPEGETVDVGTKLAVISAAAPAAKTEEDEEPAPEAAPEPAPAAEKEPEAAPEPAPTRDAAETPPAARGEGGPVLSPVVRRLLSEHNLDPAEVVGSGAGGRITRNDVLDFIDKKGDGARRPAPAAARAPAPAPAPALAAGESDEVIPFSNIRRRTAEHMVRSLATSAHTLVVGEVDYHNVDVVRGREKDAFRAAEGVGLTYLPFIARAVVDAIREFPHVNASVGDNELIVHRHVNLGIAVDLDFEGLIVPVVHEADGKRLRALAREFADLAGRARAKGLGADDIAGGTFTLTNAGPFGTFLTAPIINQPQVAVLATDGVKMRPAAVDLGDGEWAVAVHPIGNLCLSFDHRAYDGAYASAFLGKIKEILETRDWAQELA